MDQREKDRLLWNLKSLPNELEDLLKDLDEETLRWRPIPNKWSIKEIMCHLRDMEREAYLSRYQRILMLNTVDLTRPYVVDVFRVTGGTTHDYLLHGAIAADDLLGAAARSPRAEEIYS